VEVRDSVFEPKGYQQITDLSAAVGLTVPSNARYALLKCTVQAVRWRDDGTNPTATVGMLIDVGDEFFYTGKLQKIKFIEAVAGAVLNVSFYR
jgi:hypothetical protein